MNFQPVHIYKNRLDRNLNIFLLFIPAVIFVLILLLFFSKYNQAHLPRDENETVLGEEVEGLDRPIPLPAQ